MYQKGTVNDKQRKDAGNLTLCPYRNFSQAIMMKNKLPGVRKKLYLTLTLNFEAVITLMSGSEGFLVSPNLYNGRYR